MNGMNAWRDPWVSVWAGDGTEIVLSLRDLYRRAHELPGLGPGLTPLDMDSLLRFLPAIGAMILNEWGEHDDTEFIAEGRYPEEAIEAFEGNFDLSLFDLFGPKPFLQRWDKTPADVDALVDGKKKFLTHDAPGKSLLRPLEQLHPHEPGGSSAQWAIRREPRAVEDLTVLTTLLVTTWFQTKNGNSKDIFGCGALKGSVGTWHVNPLAVFLVDPSNLGRTLLANTPLEWVMEPSVPAFFDRAQEVQGLADKPRDLYRCTYAKTLPLIYAVEGRPLGFVLGADSKIPIPKLGADDKASLGVVHDGDHTRMYVIDAKKGTSKARGSFGLRLASSEGFNQWFREDRKTDESLQRVLGVARALQPDLLADWWVGLYSETSDGKGTRTWCDWSMLPAGPVGADPTARLSFSTLMGLAAKARGAVYHGLKVASGDSQTPAAVDMAQAALFARIQHVLTDALLALAADAQTTTREHAQQLVRISIDSFHASTEIYATPQNTAAVSLARSAFARSIRASFMSTYSEERARDEQRHKV